MKATITKDDEPKESKYGGIYQMICFNDGVNSYRSYLSPKMGNYKNWTGLLEVGNVLDNLIVKKKGLIDADSKPVLID